MSVIDRMDPATIHFDCHDESESTHVVPQPVEAALKNVALCREKATPPIQHRGEFWYWRLTPYGLALMRLLVRSSAGGFTYFETFLEPDPTAIPQMVLLADLNAALSAQISGHSESIDWAAILDHSPYLHAQQAVIDPAAFERAIDRMKAQILAGRFEMSGARRLPERPAR